MVKIVGGHLKGRIGNYDDDDDDEKNAIVYLGPPIITPNRYLIPYRHLNSVSLSDLMNRNQEIFTVLMRKLEMDERERAELLGERSLIEGELSKRMFITRLASGGKKRVFISHSAKDKEFARTLADELANTGHSPWLDEWKIRVGESIPVKISEGIKDCDALIVVLSEHAVASRWVENEWQAKYWDEIEAGHVMVLPVLLKKCEIPTLLKTKRYANFVEDYNEGLESLLIALKDEV